MPEGLDFQLGFAIDDPMGLDALLLARALIRFGQAVPEAMRAEVARKLEALTERMKVKSNVDSNFPSSCGGVRVRDCACSSQEDDGRKLN